MPLELPPSAPMTTLFAVDTPPQWLDFVARRPRALAASAETVVLRSAHVDRARELAAIGRRAYGNDRPGADHWDDEPPFVDGVQTPGFDCENLALWVRRALAVEFDDWPLGCGRPAICRLQNQMVHCVLIVVTPDGDYAIGALPHEDFVPWTRLEGYRWLCRLHAEDEWRGILP